jgi:putative glutamine amidotransferase
MARPRIGISALAGAGPLETYAAAVAEAGGEPVQVASAGPEAPPWDGLVLPGGPDFAPPDPSVYPSRVRFRAAPPERLALDRALLAAARARGRPVLAVCYGMQLLALECGGALVFDVVTDCPEAADHQLARDARHPIAIEPGTRLALALGASEALVNSRHHQAVSDPGRGLRVSARAPDGLIEAVEGAGGAAAPLLLGVQWHPEDLDRSHRAALYGALCDAVRRP